MSQPEETDAEAHKHCVSCFQGYTCRLNASCPVRHCPNGCGAWTHACKMDDHVVEVCVLSKVDCPNEMYGCPKKLQRRHMGVHLRSCPANVIRCMLTTMRPTDSCSSDGVTVATGPYDRQLCGEFIRRDTFADHMLEHTDTQTALDGWYEARCPLANLGCSFVYRRWQPEGPQSCLRFNTEVDGFVTCMSEDEEEEGRAGVGAVAEPSCETSLLRLPIEILLRIFSMLDGLSLTSLSVTCSTMRAACAMLLSKKGCVTREWRQNGDGKWELDATRHWQLNRSMDAVRKWRFTDDGLSALQRHLQTCSYNNHEPYTNESVHVMIG